MNNNLTILITGCAGFIGAALTKKFLSLNYKVVGIDNINDYYDQNLKFSRLNEIHTYAKEKKCLWKFFEVSICDKYEISKVFLDNKPNIVVNLAAQAGVRFSIKNPEAYLESNLNGFFNILENCRVNNVNHLVYASSSSVYGSNKEYPFDEEQKVNQPLSFYAATKISNEMMAYAYSNIYKMPITGLRFFTVFGPWGRPDMAPMIFSKNILTKKPLKIFNFGRMKRDFTYISDIVHGTYLCCLKPPTLEKIDKSNHNRPPHKLFNIGFGRPINLMEFINLLEDSFSIKAIKHFEPIQDGDAQETFASTKKLEEWIDFKPKVSIEEGVNKFTKWYLRYYG